MKILVAEDDQVSQKLMESILSKYGSCEIVADGEAAVKAIVDAYESESPFDLLCLDIMMPGVDGQEALKTIREEEHKRGILGLDGVKIIMVSALDDPKNVLGAFRSGCEGYITKPVDRNALIEKLKEFGIGSDATE